MNGSVCPRCGQPLEMTDRECLECGWPSFYHWWKADSVVNGLLFAGVVVGLMMVVGGLQALPDNAAEIAGSTRHLALVIERVGLYLAAGCGIVACVRWAKKGLF